jgi:hypothetical protein
MQYKKLWEEIFACFLLIRHGPHRKQKIRGDTKTHRQQGHLINLDTTRTAYKTKNLERTHGYTYRKLTS